MGCGASSSAPVGTPESGGGARGGPLGRQATLEDEYTLGQELGSGAFASAHFAVRKSDNSKVAVKTLKRNHSLFNLEMLSMEIQVMRAVDHPRCIRLLDVLEDKKSVHLIEEVASGGELFDRIINMPSGHLTEKDAAYMIGQVLEGIAHMHEVGAIHRDLKPENLLLMSSDQKSDEFLNIKIADFGLSSLGEEGGPVSSTKVCG